ncbi:MAG: DegV family protein, partial [Gemmatimonadales bacterium]
VSRDVAHAAQGASERTHNLVDFWRRILKEGNESLRRTPELLASLKEAGVVDAGGQGFIRLLEGVMRLIDGDPIVAPSQRFDSPSAASLADVETDKDFQYCTEVLVRGADLPASNDVRHVLRKLGGSIVVLAAGDLLKVHVHTDTPETVFELAHTWGKVESTKADDMREQHEELHTDAREVAIVVDSSCDLPDSLLDDHDIILVPLQVIRDGQAFQDRLDPETRNIYEQMRAGAVFTTSQPTPGAFSRTYRDALGQANKVFSPILASALSGTFNSAQTAANSVDSERITLFDSRTASLGLGLLALLAAEMAQQGRSPSQISAALEKARARSAGFFTVDVFDNLLRSGRVGRGKALLGSLLSIKPILEVGLDGAIAPADRARGRTAVIPKVLQILEQRLSPRPTELRMAIAHADDPESAERLEAELQQRFSPKQIVVGPVTPAIGVHVGPGAWAVFYQIEDDVFGD